MMGMMMLRVTKTMMSESMAATKLTSDCMTARRQGEAKRKLIISIDDHELGSALAQHGVHTERGGGIP
jgi:hypothetical protein